jgi:hypothetical protein
VLIHQGTDVSGAQLTTPALLAFSANLSACPAVAGRTFPHVVTDATEN